MADLRAIQQKLGVPATGQWDAMTSGAIAAFQLQNKGPLPMQAHGRIDPPTLVNLGYYDPSVLAKAPSSAIVRDASVVLNQVPRWAWFGLVAIFGYVAWRSLNDKPEKK